MDDDKHVIVSERCVPFVSSSSLPVSVRRLKCTSICTAHPLKASNVVLVLSQLLHAALSLAGQAHIHEEHATLSALGLSLLRNLRGPIGLWY